MSDRMSPPWHDPAGAAWMVYARDYLADLLPGSRKVYLKAARRALGLLRMPKQVLVEDREIVRTVENANAYLQHVVAAAGRRNVSIGGETITIHGQSSMYVPAGKKLEGRVNLRWWTASHAGAVFGGSDRRKWIEATSQALTAPNDFPGAPGWLTVEFIRHADGAVGKLQLMPDLSLTEYVNVGNHTEVAYSVDWDEEVSASGTEYFSGQRLSRITSRGARRKA